jgi:hypothetical protein
MFESQTASEVEMMQRPSGVRLLLLATNSLTLLTPLGCAHCGDEGAEPGLVIAEV